MRLWLLEWKRLMRYPVLWALLAVFLVYDFLLVRDLVGQKEYRKQLRELYPVIREYGQDPASGTGDAYQAFYAEYIEEYGDVYDTIDMQKIKEQKQRIGDFYPKGSYQRFIDANYERLRQRVDRIRADGDTQGGYYPGDVYGVHGKLYTGLRLALLELLILMSFSVLYLMDYDRIHVTAELVCACRTGRRCLLTKWTAGLAGGVCFGALLLTGYLTAFLLCIPMRGLWATPVSSIPVMEPRYTMLYPFITFVRLSLGGELLLSLFTILLLALLVGLFAGAAELLSGSSYFTMLLLGVGFLGLLALVYAVQPLTGWLTTIGELTPAALWRLCGGWFIENELSLSFAWSEFWTLGIWGTVGTGLLLAGWRHFSGKDL